MSCASQWLRGTMAPANNALWIARLVSFGVKTATRIALATETTAYAMSHLADALSPEARERNRAAPIFELK